MSEFVDVVPGPDGEGVEVPATMESLSARVREFQREWDDAERELAAAKAENAVILELLRRIRESVPKPKPGRVFSWVSVMDDIEEFLAKYEQGVPDR